MALDLASSRLSNLAEKPRPPVPSRTSSLKYTRSGRLPAKANFTPLASSARATTSGETPASSWGASNPVTTRHSSVDRQDAQLEYLQAEPTIGIKRSLSTRPSPSHVKMDRRSTSCAPPLRSTMRACKVQRWMGLTRTVSGWDGLRRDPELWFEDGDCLVHLYARGQSRRGPSFKVPFEALRKKSCGALFSLCFAQMTPAPGSTSKASRRVSMGLTTPVSATDTCELYIPAPDDATREASFQWHITTRNFFAFVFGKPLVGAHLGQTLVDLQERMHLFRSGQINNHRDFLEYADRQGYRDFVDFPDYALAMLYYAEHYQLRDVWVDAFVHCVGQNEELTFSSEFEPISRMTKALITRAYLEMDIHLGRVSIALTNFLEDDFSPAFLGLSNGARAHLERFRSFMHGFYVEKFGYWPPPTGTSFSKSLYKSMYFDIKSLYDYLVDPESSVDLASQKPASGGICVLQNVQAFDERHGFAPLPRPLPLVPKYEPLTRRTNSQKALRTLTLGSKQAKTDRYMTTRSALTGATNTRDFIVMSSPVVQAYMRFERQCALNNQREEKVSMADARKVRWLLIYGTLQYLISALRAPNEVRNTEDPVYPLCCLVAEQAPWQMSTQSAMAPPTPSVNVPEAINNYLSETDELTTTLNIQPDCERDDYFTHTNPAASRPISVEMPAPLRLKSPSRRSSIRSFVPLPLSGRSSRRNSVTMQTAPQPLSEVLLQSHDNDANEPVIEPTSQPMVRTDSFVFSQQSSRSGLPDGPGPETWYPRPSTPHNTSRAKRPRHLELDTPIPLDQARTPVFDSFQMDQLVGPVTPDEMPTAISSSDSMTSSDSPFWSDGASSTSSKSSTSGDAMDRKPSVAQDGGLLGGLVTIDSLTPKLTPKRTLSTRSMKSIASITPSRRGSFRFSFSSPHVCDSDDIMDVDDSRNSFEANFDIGVALSGPPSAIALPLSPAPVGAVSFDRLPSSADMSTHIPTSLSVESLVPAKSGATLKPSKGEQEEKVLDIFSALSLGPSGPRQNVEDVAPHIKSETSRDVAVALPPTVSKAPTGKTKKASADEERGRKKDRRKSFAFFSRRG